MAQPQLDWRFAVVNDGATYLADAALNLDPRTQET
jgi:hypothetical protein